MKRKRLSVSLFAVAVACSAAFAACRSRSHNASAKSAPTDDAPSASHSEFFHALLAKVRNEASLDEDFTWDLDCQGMRRLKFSSDAQTQFDPSEGSDVRAPSLEKAVILARASFLSYRKDRLLKGEAKAWGFDGPVDFVTDESTGSQAYVLSNATTVLVVFRGTSSNLDILTDLDLRKRKESAWGLTHRGFTMAYNGGTAVLWGRALGTFKEGIQAKLFTALTAHGYDAGLWSSTGQRNAQGDTLGGNSTVDADGFQSGVSAGAKEKATKQLWITGHSLGGGLAQLLAADLTEREIFARTGGKGGTCGSPSVATNYVTGVVTFGSPRVGDEEFKKCFDQGMQARNWRFMHNNDIVPQIPWAELGYRHAGEFVYLSSEGELKKGPTLTAMGLDMYPALLAKFAKTGLSALKEGIEDHGVYVQPLQHNLDKRCSFEKGVQPAEPTQSAKPASN